MRRTLRLSLTLILLATAGRVYAYTIPYEAWMGAYVAGKKIGYLCYKIDKSDLNDSSVYMITSVMNNRMTVLGTELSQAISTTVYTDAKYYPLKETFSMSSGGKTTAVVAVFKPDRIECEMSGSTGSSKQTVPIPKGVTLVGDAMFTTPDIKMEIGKEYSQYYFNPLTLSIDSLKIKAEGREKITVNGKEYDAMIVTNATAMGDMKVWQTDDGDVLKITAMMGIMMVREDKDKAMAGIEPGKSDDFAVLTSLKPDRRIEEPRSVKSLDIVLKGISDRSMAISDARQKAEFVKGESDSVRFRVKASNFKAAKSISLPVDRKKFAGDLASTPYINCAVQEVKDQAKKIVGDEKNAYKACCKLRDWIHANMKSRADIGITRSASDVLQSMVGVCRDYGILFAGLARAAGIPTRIAAGMLYVNGAFYYHVWVECFVGEWVPFDATLSTDFVDATHIKIACGDAPSMFGLSKVIGSLKAEIKSYK